MRARGGARSVPARGHQTLFLLAGTQVRLPACTLLAWRRRDHLDLLLLGFLGFPIASLLTFSHVDLPGLTVMPELTQTRRLETRRVQIISDFQRPDQIERADAIEIVGLRRWPTDTRAPSVSIVENKHRHPRRPGTMEGPCLLDNHILELTGGLEGSDAHGLPPGPLVGAPLSFKLIELIRQQDPAPGRGYPHVQITFLQKLVCLLDGRPCRRTAKIDPAKLIVAANQVMQF